MKKLYWLTLLLLLAAGTVFAQIRANSDVWVSADSINLKSSTWFFASNVGTVEYGDQVRVLQVSGNWAQVRPQANQSITGWISIGNLIDRRITRAGNVADLSETAHAGRAFNQEVENEYKASGNYNYADIDETEKLGVSEEELLRFITDGRLLTGEPR